MPEDLEIAGAPTPMEPLDFPVAKKEPKISEKDLLEYTDYDKFRDIFKQRTMDAVSKAFPIQNQKYTLRVSDLHYGKNDTYSLAKQKKAILEKSSLTHQLKGSWEVIDNETGKTITKSKPRTLLNVPYITPRGTYIRRGTEYTINKQLRLRPGLYSRVTNDGMLESQFNVKHGTGSMFKTFFDPAKSLFYFKKSGKKIPMLPVLRAMGVPEENIKKAWGEEIYKTNTATLRSPHAISFLNKYVRETDMQNKTASLDFDKFDREKLLSDFSGQLEEDVVESTTGMRQGFIDPALMLAASSKQLKMSRGEAEADERDSLEFQSIADMSDYLAEKIEKDQNRLMRNKLWKLTGKGGNVETMEAGILDKHVDHIFNDSGVSQAIEMINPADYFDQAYRISRLGEGAMSSLDVAPKESRNVQPSYMNFIDPIRSPESMKIGLDMRLARNVRRGPKNLLYTKFINAKTGEEEWVDSLTAARANIATPEYMNTGSKFVPSVTHRGTKNIKREEVDYFVPSGDDLFSNIASTVPLKSGVKGMRLLMGSKFSLAALPIVGREAPHVRTTASKGSTTSMESKLGKNMGAVMADMDGEVIKVSPSGIKVRYADGTEKEHELYNNMPFARSTYMRSIPAVKKGDKVNKGSLLAASNYTNDKGVTAVGRNLRTAYWGYDGQTFEDNIVISEAAARKMTSEHMYTEEFEKDKDTTTGLSKFKALYPTKFNPRQLKQMDDNGAVKKGSILQYGDPIVLGVTERKGSDTLGRKIRSDASRTWKHKYPGVVTDVTNTRKGFNVAIRANVPMQDGDKLSIRQGGKGVVTLVKDEDMPRDAQGRPLEVIMSPHGIISRTNSSQMIEAQLGKIADKTGKTYTLDGFMEEDMAEFAQKELEKHGLSDKEDLFNPKTGKKVPGIFTGNLYYYKQQHTAEKGGKARALGGYTEDEQPGKGGKHLGVMEIQALLGHGATEVLKDMKLVKGQKNDGFWRQLMLGQTPDAPRTPLVYAKFKDMMRAAGIQIYEGKNSDNIMAMTNEGATKLTGDRQIRNANTYSQSNFKPMEGGLFDPKLTDAAGEGKRWSYIQLPEPMVNPVMLDPIRRILGLSNKEAQQHIRRGTLNNLIKKVDLDAVKEQALDNIRNGARTKRDDAIKQFRAVHAMEKAGTKPSDYLMERVPVLPPKYRPITQSHGMNMVNDANYMYSSLMHTASDFTESKGLTEDIREDARDTMYKTYSALVGLTDPVQEELQKKGVGGILRNVIGKGSPKLGFIQRRVLGTKLDTTGAAVITPNPALNLNQVGLPEDKAYDLYEPFIIRNLVKSGMSGLAAAKAVKEKSKPARKALEEVVTQRPVIVNRAPSLHKYSVMAMWPRLIKGKTLQIPPPLVAPFGADFDGDKMSYSVPVSKAAVDEAIEKMMPDKNLLSDATGAASYVPGIEFLQGLFLARKKARKGKTRVFSSMKEAKRAYSKGEIKIDDPIEIKGQR